MAYIGLPPIYYGNPEGTEIYMKIDHPVFGEIPFLAVPDDVVQDGAETFAAAVNGDYGPVVSYADSHYYSTINNNSWDELTFNMGDTMVSPFGIQPDNSTTIAPPSFVQGVNRFYWWPLGDPTEGWILSTFDPYVYTSLSLAKTNLQTQLDAYTNNALNQQLRNYTTVEIATSPDISKLLCADYPVTYGVYSTYVNSRKAVKVAVLDSAVSLEELFSFVPNDWSTVYPMVASGVIFTGRGSGAGPEDLNVSYYREFNSDTLAESGTELYVPGTNTVIPYGSGGPGKFDSFGNCFNPGDYLIQIRQVSNNFVIAEFNVPLNPSGQDVLF